MFYDKYKKNRPLWWTWVYKPKDSDDWPGDCYYDSPRSVYYFDGNKWG